MYTIALFIFQCVFCRMFPFRSPEQLIIEYTEYLFRTKVEKRVYLDENFVEYVGSYVYGIVKESASLMADMTSRIYNQAILPIVTFTSDTLFQLISSSTDVRLSYKLELLSFLPYRLIFSLFFVFWSWSPRPFCV